MATEDQHPSGATPDGETTPVTGETTEPTGETPKTPTIDDLQKQLADRESALKAARQESIERRKKLDAFEKAQKEHEDAQLSELDKTKKRLAELEETHTKQAQETHARIIRYEVTIAAARLGIIDPEAAAKLLDYDALEYDDGGQPTNVEKVLKKLAEDKPYLVKQEPGALRINPGATNPSRAASGNAGIQHVTYEQYLQMPQHERTRAMREGKLKIITQ